MSNRIKNILLMTSHSKRTNAWNNLSPIGEYFQHYVSRNMIFQLEPEKWTPDLYQLKLLLVCLSSFRPQAEEVHSYELVLSWLQFKFIKGAKHHCTDEHNMNNFIEEKESYGTSFLSETMKESIKQCNTSISNKLKTECGVTIFNTGEGVIYDAEWREGVVNIKPEVVRRIEQDCFKTLIGDLCKLVKKEE